MIDYFLLVATGLIIGSFLGAFTYRYPRKISVAKGRSFCPKCKKQISWYDNIPLLSYIMLRGKCRKCGKIISIRYPIIELFTAILFVLIGFNVYLLLLTAILLTVFIIDLEHQIIPDSLVFFLIFLSLFYLLPFTFYSQLLVGFSSALFLLMLNFITRGQGMGLGDVKLAIPMGIILGFPKVLTWLMASFIIGGIAGVILIILGKAGLKSKISFGPFMIIGFAIAMLLKI